MSKKVLGKGLGALLSSTENIAEENDIINISLQLIQPNSLQPRKAFNEEKLRELADSIKEKGIIQPIVVTRQDGKYEIIVGERRWRACQMAGLRTIPAILKEVSSYEKLELALIENIQRRDLNSIEEATSFKELLENLNLTQEQLSSKIGKSRTAIANTLRLLKLPESIQKDITHEILTEGHGRALLSLKNEENIFKAKNIITQKSLSVRQTEKLIQQMNDGIIQDFNSDQISSNSLSDKKDITLLENSNDLKSTSFELQKDLKITEIERELELYLNTTIRVKPHPTTSAGKIEIKYKNYEELERIIQLLGLKQSI